MKKIYTLMLLAAAALGANAQVVLVAGEDEVQLDPAVEYVSTAEVENWGSDDDPYWSIKACEEINVKNLGSAAANFSVTVTTDDWEYFTWCGISTQCQPMSAKTETRSGSIGAGKTLALSLDGSFVGMDEDYEPILLDGPYYVTITVKEGDKTTDYKVKAVNPKSTGIVAIQNDALKQAKYDLTGRRVLNPTSGQIYIQGGKKYIQR